MRIAEFRKDPHAINDYTVNFDTVLEPDGERLASVVWTVPAGITLGTGIYGPALSADLRKSTFWLQGGTAGNSYEVTGHYVTDHSPPREDDVSVLIVVRNL